MGRGGAASDWFYLAAAAFAGGVGLLVYVYLFGEGGGAGALLLAVLGLAVVGIAPVVALAGVAKALRMERKWSSRWRERASLAIATVAYIVATVIVQGLPALVVPLLALVALNATPTAHRRGPHVFLVVSTASATLLAAAIWIP